MGTFKRFPVYHKISFSEKRGRKRRGKSKKKKQSGKKKPGDDHSGGGEEESEEDGDSSSNSNSGGRGCTQSDRTEFNSKVVEMIIVQFQRLRGGGATGGDQGTTAGHVSLESRQ